MTREEAIEMLASMMRQAQELANSGDAVYVTIMPRVIAILHEARQLSDMEYLDLKPD